MIYLDLQPEVEAQLAAEARARGIAVDRYLREIVACRADITEQRLLDESAEADAGEGIRQGLEQLHRGEGRPAGAFFDELRDEYELSR